MERQGGASFGGFSQNGGGFSGSQFGGNRGQSYSSQSGSQSRRQNRKNSNVGDVTIKVVDAKEKQVSKNVGETVDFEEIKN